MHTHLHTFAAARSQQMYFPLFPIVSALVVEFLVNLVEQGSSRSLIARQLERPDFGV